MRAVRSWSRCLPSSHNQYMQHIEVCQCVFGLKIKTYAILPTQSKNHRRTPEKKRDGVRPAPCRRKQKAARRRTSRRAGRARKKAENTSVSFFVAVFENRCGGGTAEGPRKRAFKRNARPVFCRRKQKATRRRNSRRAEKEGAQKKRPSCVLPPRMESGAAQEQPKGCQNK